MSRLPANEPLCDQLDGAIELRISAQARDIGGFAVRRALPVMARRAVGPFVFFDHMGPVLLPPGAGVDVGPHPHIGLATVTYLFQGEIVHRDSVGSRQVIRPGALNWMVAGRGIAHSERTGDDVRARGGPVHGIQSWIALPAAQEECAPAFEHHESGALPLVQRDGAQLRIIAGNAYDESSPATVASPTLYVDARLEAAATLPVDDTHEERAIYVAQGEIGCAEQSAGPGTMLVLKTGAAATITARSSARVMLLGGARLDGPRHIWWNFVSTRKDRIEQAKADWRAGRFGTVVDDDGPPLPLPDR